MTTISLTGQVALVTGASRGIGKAIALALGRHGAVVVGTATTAKGAERIGATIAEAGLAGRGAELDVADAEAVDRLVRDIAGNEGPIHRCSIYGSAEAGQALNAMLEMGRSRPWPEALEAMTGTPDMDATAILDYFAPLAAWLEEQNADRSCGW